MNKLTSFFLLLALFTLSACQAQTMQSKTREVCTEAWYQAVELKITSGDGMGHGPDIGSDEWKSVIEFKLGIRDNPSVPERNSSQWCNYIDDFIYH